MRLIRSGYEINTCERGLVYIANTTAVITSY